MRTLEQLKKEIRDPAAIFYGPHECHGCGRIVVRRAKEQGQDLTLDAAEFNHHYPNFVWLEHVCTPSGLPIGQAGGKARAKKLGPKKIKEAASKAANVRWGKGK